MTFRRILPLALALALGLVLAGPARAAAPEERSFGRLPQALTAAWAWLQGLWEESDRGCDIDPNGKPWCGGAATAESDHGCNIDPNGKPWCGGA